MSDKLRPCPFCGAGYGLHIEKHRIGSRDTFGITCSICGCQISNCFDEESAIYYWNMRGEDRLTVAAPELKDIVKEFVEKAVIPIRPPERDPLGEVMAVLVQQWVDDDLLNRAQSLLRWIEGEEAREA